MCFDFMLSEHFQPAQGLVSEPAKLWPNIPPPHAQSAPIPVPMCNGCGVTGASTDGLLLLGSSLGKTGQKYGQCSSTQSLLGVKFVLVTGPDSLYVF